MPKGDWKEYFAFSKRQRKAVFILLGVMAVFIFCTFWYKPMFTPPVVDAQTQQQLTALSAKHHGTAITDTDEEDTDSTSETSVAKTTKSTPELFYFDPNTLDDAGWNRLGFHDKTLEHIKEYKQKGAFTKPEDLYKVFRIRKKSVERVLPYIRIGAIPKKIVPQKADSIAKQPSFANTTTANIKPININTATAEDFKAFPGVTDAVATRIIKFRTSINGFKSIDDVAKTYGLTKESFAAMKPYLKL